MNVSETACCFSLNESFALAKLSTWVMNGGESWPLLFVFGCGALTNDNSLSYQQTQSHSRIMFKTLL